MYVHVHYLHHSLFYPFCFRLMKNSAPLINTVIIVGCILLMSTCILLGIDSANPKVVDGELDLTDIPDSAKKRYATICTVRLWFLTIGFTLSFGALFAKTWQVYRVYTNPTKLKDKVQASSGTVHVVHIVFCICENIVCLAGRYSRC